MYGKSFGYQLDVDRGLDRGGRSKASHRPFSKGGVPGGAEGTAHRHRKRTDWFCDRFDLAACLDAAHKTACVLAFAVLRYPEDPAKRNDALFRTPWPCLYVDGIGNDGWTCHVARNIEITGEPFRPAPIHAMEQVTGDPDLFGWKKAGYGGKAFSPAKPYSFLAISLSDSPFHLLPRTILPLAHEMARFAGVVCERQDGKPVPAGEDVLALIRGEGPLVVPANTERVVEVSADVLQCGYLHLAIEGGKGAEIALLPSECYCYPQPPRKTPFGEMALPPKKGDRTDYQKGVLFGPTDTYAAAGCGTKDEPEVYEPFWFSTFRFLQLRVKTGEEPVSISAFTYTTTGYPLEVRTTAKASDPDFAGIWDISLRSLARCMHETYIDCPFYEQLQYAMDSRSEILYTYAVSADDRLARQAMEAFRLSQRPDGCINSCAPATRSNVIPGFSIYYVLMVYDHMMYFGDPALVRRHLPAITGVLDFFDRHLGENGLVGKVGGPLYRAPYWSFIDWSTAWTVGTGVPGATAEGTGQLTMESLLYLYGLQAAERLARFVQLPDLEALWRTRAEALSSAIKTAALGENGLYQDGPGIGGYSVHCQVFAILTGLADPCEGKRLLQATLGKDGIAQPSVAFSFYLFRALEKADWYERAAGVWDLWRRMLAEHLTTCVENDTDARSDCHAWGGTLLYELPGVYLGVRPAAPGYGTARIRPVMGHLTFAEGSVATPKGTVRVSWTKRADGTCDIKCGRRVQAPGLAPVSRPQNEEILKRR